MYPRSDDDLLEDAERRGLYARRNEHDACGVGFVVNIKGKRSHGLIEQALLILRNLNHRGAVGADPLYGDGAGILIQIPDICYREQLHEQGVKLPPPGEYGVGMVFLPREHASRLACEQELERSVRAEGQAPRVRWYWAGAMCRSSATCRCRRGCASASQSFDRSS
jgi:glutamate synthase (NADPH/NADH) large chain